MSDMLHGKSAPLLDYDAICTFVFRDYRDFAKFMYDPASKALTPDHENFSESERTLPIVQGMYVDQTDVFPSLCGVVVEDEMRMMVGDEYMVIEDGKQVKKLDESSS